MKKTSKILAMFMAVLMIAGCFGGLTAFADEPDTQPNIVEEALEGAPVEEAPAELNCPPIEEPKCENKATLLTAPEARNRTYAGQLVTDPSLVTMGTAKDGVVMYALGKDSTTVPDFSDWSIFRPTAVDAGTYYVWYFVMGYLCFENTEPQCIEVTISPREISLKWDEETTFVYNGLPQAPKAKIAISACCENNVVCPDVVNILYSGVEKDSCAKSDVDNYTVTAALDNPNYVIKAGEETCDYTIEKANLTYTAPEAIEGLVYNSELQKLVTPGTVQGVVVKGVPEQVGKFSYVALYVSTSRMGFPNPIPDENSSWSEAVPSRRNAGKYIIWFKIDPIDANGEIDENYNPVAQIRIDDSEIAKKVVTIKATAKDKMFDGTTKAELEKYEIIGGKLTNENIIVDESSIQLEFTQAEPGKDIPVDFSAKVQLLQITRTELDGALLPGPIEEELDSTLDNYEIVFDGGVADILKIPAKKPAPPRTGDNGMAVLWASMILVLGSTAVVILKEKEN